MITVWVPKLEERWVKGNSFLCTFFGHRNQILAFDGYTFLQGCSRCSARCTYEIDIFLDSKDLSALEDIGWIRPESISEHISKVFHPVIRHRKTE